MIPRHDLFIDASPEGIEVFQLTTEPDVPSAHIYMEAQIFTPDSKCFILHRSAHAHAGATDDSLHEFLICDIENGCELIPIIQERRASSPSMSPDGRLLYYFINETEPGRGRLTLKRVRMDGAERETLLVLDGPVPDTDFRVSRPYCLSTISSDGKRLCLSGYLGDGNTPNAPWGILVFELDQPSVRLIRHDRSFCNVHPQYSRSLDPEASHDILIQDNHGNERDASGAGVKLTGGAAADIHVIRDDGTNFRNMPWGRDGNEFCQGHQCWRGRGGSAITSTGKRDVGESQLIEGQAAPFAGHVGISTPGGVRNDLSRSFETPKFSHFATDIAGQRLITDARPSRDVNELWLFDLPEQEGAPLANARLLLRPNSSWVKETHIHPFLSPDATMGFFNSDESGILQAYMVTGL